MSNSNGYNPNSLLTLEQSLLAPKRESEEHSNQHIEAQAFDWDESIDLDYSEAESWHYPNYGSQSFDIEEDIPTYDVQAFEVEEAEPTLDYQDPLSQSNSLFALEQSVLGVNAPYQPSLQFSVEEEEELERQPVESQAFDWDEAIALESEESAYPTAQSFDWLPSHESYGFNLDDEPRTYEVEAFEVEEPQPEATEEEYSSSKEYDFNIINNDNNNLSNYVAEASYDTQAYRFDADDEPEPIYQKKSPSPPIKAPEPVEALSDDDFDEFERASTEGRASDAEAFTADLASILRGEKVYEPPKETPVQAQSAPFSSTPQPLAPQPQSPPEPVTPKQPRPHDVFDQMGRNVSHATAFDLGTFSLEQRFDEFDRMLDEQDSESLAYVEEDSSSNKQDISYRKIQDKSVQYQGFDEEEMAADLAALGVSDSFNYPDKEIAMEDETSEALSTNEVTQTLDPDSPEMEMERLLSESKAYSGALVAPAPSTLPALQGLIDIYTGTANNPARLLTQAEVTEIQRLSIGGTAAGPSGTKALTDRSLMDYQAMVTYANGNNFNNWETLPKPTRLQVATYQWGAHNPPGADMSNKPGYWKARSVDANSNPQSATAAASRQAIYNRDRDIWIYTLNEPSQAAKARIPGTQQQQQQLLITNTAVRRILQRIFALLHLGLTYRNGNNPYQAWTQHVAVALSHGGRVNVKLPANSGDDILNWLFVSQAIKDQAGVGTRASSTHNIKITQGGQFQEKKELFKFIGMTHYALNLAVGGIGNLDVNGNPILPNGSYGHLYLGYRKPEANTMGGMLIGIENDAYGSTNPLGHKHGLSAKEAEMSPTGGLKVDKIGSPAGPGDTGFMLVDLTTVANLTVKLGNVVTKLNTANQGGAVTINATAQRLTGAIDPTLFT
ncbi:hypothetical protein NIES2101_26305 [Calothrix sp. HK-06]|nr:hypothetical protein NIES2101_26305 [Calothrix sp. HK-06]